MLTECLQKNIVSQKRQCDIDPVELKKLKSIIKREKVKRCQSTLDFIKENVSDEMANLINITTERGVSLWLSTLPIKEEGFQLDKQSWDLLKIRYSLFAMNTRTMCLWHIFRSRTLAVLQTRWVCNSETQHDSKPDRFSSFESLQRCKS